MTDEPAEKEDLKAPAVVVLDQLQTQLDLERADAAALQRYLYFAVGMAAGLTVALYLALEHR